MKRPAFWIVLALVSVVSAFVAIRYFPQAFSIVALDITMDRERALEGARAIMARDGLGPAGYRQAASFALDSEAQTFIELEGGGKEAFTRMLRDGLYSAYTWRVRQFRESEPNETTIRFTPEGRPYGFVEKLREDAPGAALDATAARRIAEAGASRWNVDLSAFTLVEQGQERRAGGRVDHTLTYERPAPTLNDGRYRLRLAVSGDRLTEVTYFISIPQAFSRRYANMRSANEAIGMGAVVGMSLLYVLGGIGVGLFFMLRQRWVIWRPAAVWGAAVALLQALAMLNELPLSWMEYNTAIPRSTFLTQQIAIVIASFIGFSAFFALSFMAAETLTRRAFGHHPQLWRVWSNRSETGRPEHAPGASRSILGRTAAAYLLVPVFLAYDVMLYFLATRYLGWWSPSEALLHPDVLATYVPWLSTIANSLQAGFWEEALFRAVPLAGAALIGDRFGKRRLFLILGFIVQTIVFGAGHAPYPAMPSYVRPVELIIPSIGFGLLYVYFGLVPGIILHYAFDAVLFGIPIFLADAPGIWLQKAMVVLLVLVPLWIVLVRRMQAGRLTELSPADRNQAWTPPPVVERPAAPAAVPHGTLSPRARSAWLVLGATAPLVSVVALSTSERQTMPITRQRAEALGRAAMEQRGATFDARWRVMPSPDNGSGGSHEFVAVTAGEERRKQLVGRYLPAPRWNVRAATFQGDVVDRAEEWRAFVTGAGEARSVIHTLPEGRAGASLDESSARQLAHKAVADRLGLDPAREVKEVSAKPSKHAARTDWTFEFVDATVVPLPQGEPRVVVHLAGDEIASATRMMHVPEEWDRRQQAAQTRNLILRIANTMVFAGILVGTAVVGLIAWSKRRYTPWLFLAAAALMLLASMARSANNWPTVLASLRTDAPLQLQIVGIIGIGLVGLAISAVLVGLVLGAMPHRIAASGSLPDRDALRLAIALGLYGAAASAAAAWLRTPAWAHFPNLEAAGAFVPMLQVAIDPVPRVLMASAVVLPALLFVQEWTSAWTRRRVTGAAFLIVIGFAAGGIPAGVSATGWVLAGLVTAAALVIAYITLLRYDLTLVPLALATMIAIGALGQGVQRAFPGALAGSMIAALLAAGVGWWWFNALRRARARVAAESAQPVAVTAE